MKTSDLVGNRVVVYDSSNEKLSRFCIYLREQGYKCTWRKDNVLVRQPCVLLPINNSAFLCEMSEAVKENYILIPTMALSDFAEKEHKDEREREKRIEKLLAEAFPNSERE